MNISKEAVLILEDGTIFYGKSIGNNEGTSFGEICFNTGMTGYQEIFTDPSYFGQNMVMTNVHIGNYGTTLDEVESDKITISGLVCRNFSYEYSRTSANKSLEDFFKADNLFGIKDVDTRALVSYIRDYGSMNSVISTKIDDIKNLKEALRNQPSMSGLELASKVSTKAPYFYGNSDAKYKIAALDLGIKKNILKHLSMRDTYIKVFPYNTPFEEVKNWNPEGYFISNGPGDPEPLKEVQDFVKQVIDENMPMYGICLGHQIIALAKGISTYKMHNGHRGINHPVKNCKTGKCEITSQNHGFAINKKETEAHSDVEISHIHINDETVSGITLKGGKVFSVQYHPEAGPGPNDSIYLFDKFIELIKINKN